MTKTAVTAHMVVKNEDRFIWYALTSILPYADRVLISDTGSTDDTLRIIKSIKSEKIILKQHQAVLPDDIGRIRQKQLDDTKIGWIWVVDGDEIYSKASAREIKQIIARYGNDLEGIVVGRYDLLGDIHHYQDDSAGTYRLFGKKGHFALRLMNLANTGKLKIRGIYPYEGYYDRMGVEIIHHDKNKFVFTQGKLYHCMYLQRSFAGKVLGGNFPPQ